MAVMRYSYFGWLDLCIVKNFSLSLTTRGEFDSQVNKLQSENPSQALYVNITKKPKKRSLSMNAQQHVFYSEVAKYYGDQLPSEVKNFCKHTFGIPILLLDDVEGDKLEFLLHKLDYYKHSLESQLKLVSCLEITSKFKAAQAKEYCDNMIFYFNGNGINIGYQDDVYTNST